MNWSLKSFEQLDVNELYELLTLRSRVFVVEQTCVFLDLDGVDKRPDVLHLLGWQDGALVAYARLMAPGVAKAQQVVIGRVVTAPEARGDGLGHRLMQQARQECARLWPGVSIYLGAQAHLQGFYGRHGFTAVGEPYLEDDIPHIGMSSS
ncbi:GNAT family N-acetyltransferase [Aeromonas sp. V90_14]|uniref:GNAT family N-acetyltransferase n=1 Tax=Aeromonas sp. V90_14 TaxID=3044241 RepID=UPI00249F6632|nr:GNAT family N-acetyltransferase [Aeromonas sp. V90_14]MDI3432055.1 GNAT family N-acetyltransferase [Aeromonas sp. V90_14]